jgi:hypothetical protein
MIRTPFAVILLAVLACAPVGADELKTITGKTLSGTLEKISDTEIVLQSSGKPVSTPLPQVLDLTVRPATTPAKYTEVRLMDDSTLRCTKVTFGAKEATLALTSGVSIKVPLAALNSVLRDANEASVRSQWESLTKDKKNRDAIYTLKDGNLNPIYGVLGDIDEAKQTIKFKPEVLKEIEPQLEKIQALRFTRTDVPGEASLCKVIDVDGSLVVASKLAYTAGALQIMTPLGAKVAFDYKAVSKIDFNFGRLTYLSDLDPKISDVAFLGGFNPVRKDTNLDGYPLMLQDKKYDKGISVYAGTDLEYNLAGKYKDFKAIIGADARIAEEGQGKVTVVIYCDRVKQKEYVVSTKESVPIALNVKDVTTLRIVVAGSNFTGFSGHATLANAHISQ